LRSSVVMVRFVAVALWAKLQVKGSSLRER
jgi:hypothetical protein